MTGSTLSITRWRLLNDVGGVGTDFGHKREPDVITNIDTGIASPNAAYMNVTLVAR